MMTKCINYREFFFLVLNDKLKLCGRRESYDKLASWKVDGEDFYIFAKNNTADPEKKLKPETGETEEQCGSCTKVKVCGKYVLSPCSEAIDETTGGKK